MDIISFLQIYISFWSTTIQEFFPNLITYKQVALIMAIISSASIIFYTMKNNNGKVNNRFIRMSVFLLVIIILYLLTGQNSRYNTTKYQSMYLVIIGQVAPAMLTACLVSNVEYIEQGFKKLAPIVALVFTFVSYTSIVMPSSQTSSGTMLDDNGLNYQSASYMAAYAFGLAAFYFFCFDKVDWYNIFKLKFIRLSYVFILFLDFIGVLLAGGRGAVVLLTIEILVFGFFYLKECGASKSDVLRKLFLIIIGVLGIAFGIKYASSSSLETSGFYRIINTLTTGDSSGRDSIYCDVWYYFKQNPFGYGIGSVFGLIGTYSHNLFLDSLVEIGVLGPIALFIVLLKSFSNSINLIKIDLSNLIWLIVFLHGIVMALFSGYYLCNQPLCWSIAFLLSRRIIINNNSDN